MLKSSTNNIYSLVMDTIPSTIDHNKLLHVGLEIDLVANSGLAAECISINEGIRSVQLNRLTGKVVSIEDKNAYVEEKGTSFLYRVRIDNLLSAALLTKNEDLRDMLTRTVAAYNSTPREIDYSKSQAYDKIVSIENTEAAIPQTQAERLHGVPQKYNTRFFTMRYSPTVYRELYAGNKPELTSVRDTFEGTFPHIIESLFGTDLMFGVLETFPQIISTIDEELKKDYDLDTLQALKYLRILAIDVKQFLLPSNEIFTKEENQRINVVLPTSIRATFMRNSEIINEAVSVLDGIVIRNNEEGLIISTLDGLIQINQFELKLILDEDLRKKILGIFEKADINNIEGGAFFDIFMHYFEDNLMVLGTEMFEALHYIETQIKHGKIFECMELIKYLSTIK